MTLSGDLIVLTRSFKAFSKENSRCLHVLQYKMLRIYTEEHRSQYSIKGTNEQNQRTFSPPAWGIPHLTQVFNNRWTKT